MFPGMWLGQEVKEEAGDLGWLTSEQDLAEQGGDPCLFSKSHEKWEAALNVEVRWESQTHMHFSGYTLQERGEETKGLRTFARRPLP